MNNSHNLGMLLTGVISGFLSYYGVRLPGFLFDLFGLPSLRDAAQAAVVLWFWFGPGLVFGILMSLYCSLFFRTRKSSSILFGIASTAASFVASQIFVVSGRMEANLWLSLLLAGGIGSVLLQFGFSLFIASLDRKAFIPLTMFGSVSSLIFIYGGGSFVHPAEKTPLVYLYTLWQAGMAAGLGWGAKRRIGRATQ